MSALKILPTGRQLICITGDRNILTSEDIEEAIKSVDRNQGLTRVQQKARETITILDKLLRTASE